MGSMNAGAEQSIPNHRVCRLGMQHAQDSYAFFSSSNGVPVRNPFIIEWIFDW
jgi:hypothetical protein